MSAVTAAARGPRRSTERISSAPYFFASAGGGRGFGAGGPGRADTPGRAGAAQVDRADLVGAVLLRVGRERQALRRGRAGLDVQARPRVVGRAGRGAAEEPERHPVAPEGRGGGRRAAGDRAGLDARAL